ncbi:hypothetical protein IscW_ISCW003156, partial [Ixodes scapularis]
AEPASDGSGSARRRFQTSRARGERTERKYHVRKKKRRPAPSSSDADENQFCRLIPKKRGAENQAKIRRHKNKKKKKKRSATFYGRLLSSPLQSYEGGEK